jgi:hypothetical protein
MSCSRCGGWRVGGLLYRKLTKMPCFNLCKISSRWLLRSTALHLVGHISFEHIDTMLYQAKASIYGGYLKPGVLVLKGPAETSVRRRAS